MYKIFQRLVTSNAFPFFLLTIIVSGIYYKMFIFGRIPFPGDLLVVSYSPWLDYYKFPVHNPLISDVFSQFFLWKQLAIEAFKNWQWPLWNPYSFTGTPLLATYHSATLYPFNILLLLPNNFGWGLYIYSQTLIASLTFYLFSSQLVKSKIASLAGAIAFSLGGLMTTWLELGTAVHAIAWLPLALYSVKKLIMTKKLKFILILISGLSLIILSGNAQITTYSFAIVLFYFMWSLREGNKNFTKILLFIAAITISLALTALQLLPSLDLLQNSIRQTESYTASANFGLLNVKDSIKFFIPDYFGNTVTRNYWGTLNYSETSGFFGTLLLPLLLYAIFKLRGKDSFFFFILFVLSLLFVFNNPLSRSLYSMKIPLLTSSYASRMLFITLFSVSIISSLALNHIIEHKNSTFFQKTILWSWSAIIGIILGSLLVYHLTGKILNKAPSKEALQFYLSNHDYALQNFIVAAKNSLLPLIILSTALLSSIILKRLKQYNLFLIIFFLLVVFDIGRYFLKFNPFIEQKIIFPSTPTLQFLQDQPGIFRVGREHAEIFPPNTWIAYHLQSIEGYDPIYLNQFGKYMNFLNGGDIKSSSTRYAELVNYKSPFIDVANVKYFIGIGRDREGHIPGVFVNYKFNEAEYKRVFKDGSAVIFENPTAMNRVYFAKKILLTSNQEIENKFMKDKNYDPRQEILLSKDLGTSSVTGEGQAIITYYSPNKVKIKTHTGKDEVLVLADQYDSGWQGTVDRQTTLISSANLIFRAIKVPAGSHEIEFDYWPASFDYGLKITIAAIALICLSTLTAIKINKF